MFSTPTAQIHTKNEIEKMRAAGKLAAHVLNEVGKKVKIGVTTLELDDYADQITKDAGATSAPYLYQTCPTDIPFPKHICTSVNNVVCHGIPRSDVYLGKRDIVNVDITVILDGYHGDTSRTFMVKKPKPEIKKLVEATQQAMYKGIEAIKPGACISEIGKAIEEFITPKRYGIVESLTGHGIGTKFHQQPTIFHFYKPDYKLKLKPGMIFTVEPMINQGSKDIGLLDDGWTIITRDGRWSAQFEHTCLVTEDGVEILTK
jgi:methionyl aminopeptidase